MANRMKILIISLIFFLLARISLADSSCPPLFTYQSTLDKCIFKLDSLESWTVARGLCGDVGGDLLSVHNAFQNGMIAQLNKNLTGSNIAWLGAQKNSKGNWAWSDGTPFDYQRFAQNVTGDCAYLDSNDAMWKITSCTTQFAFLCAAPATLIPTTIATLTTVPGTNCAPPKQQPMYNCLQGWQYSNDTGYEYLVFFDKFFDEGEDYCQKQGAHLISIHSVEENEFIQKLCCVSACQQDHNKVFTAYYLTGGHWSKGQIVWSDGTPDDFHHEECSDQQRQEGDNLLMFNWSQCSICATPGIWHYDAKDGEDAESPYLVCKRKPQN